MTIRLDQNGYPELYEDKVNLGTVMIDVNAESGNPFHDPATGKFTFAPAGMQVLAGQDLLKGLSTNSRKTFFRRASITKANQVAARIINGNLQLVLLRDGRRVDNFAFAPKATGKKAGVAESRGGNLGVQAEDALMRDAAVDAAREGLQGEALLKFLRERNINLEGGAVKLVNELIAKNNLDDLVDYLHQTLRKKHHQTHQIDRVRISVGRGYLKRTFAGLDKAQTEIVLQRLQGRGWSEDILQSTIVSQFPSRLKKIFEIPEKQARGKKELRKIRRETPTP